ncbi:MAG: UPF0246 protein YaaA, partial [uncultured Frankineae bacterium]
AGPAPAVREQGRRRTRGAAGPGPAVPPGAEPGPRAAGHRAADRGEAGPGRAAGGAGLPRGRGRPRRRADQLADDAGAAPLHRRRLRGAVACHAVACGPPSRGRLAARGERAVRAAAPARPRPGVPAVRRHVAARRRLADGRLAAGARTGAGVRPARRRPAVGGVRRARPRAARGAGAGAAGHRRDAVRRQPRQQAHQGAAGPRAVRVGSPLAPRRRGGRPVGRGPRRGRRAARRPRAARAATRPPVL